MHDREKVIKELEYLLNVARDNYQGLIDLTVDEGNEILVLLKEQTAVVRCKDCKYYDNFNGCMSWHDVNSNNDNWYCADGERRIDDG